MTEIEAIYEKFHLEIKGKPAREYIDFYEANKAVIESGDTSIGSIDYINIVNLTSDYALALSDYGSISKALVYLDKAIKFVENEPINDLSKDKVYEMLLWIRGYQNYYKKNYKEAARDFRFLVESYPDNDKYKNWLRSSLIWKTNRLNTAAWFGLALSLGISEIFLRKKSLSIRLSADIFDLVFLIIIISVAIRKIYHQMQNI